MQTYTSLSIKNNTQNSKEPHIRKRLERRTHEQEDQQQERAGDNRGHLSHAADGLLDQRASEGGGDGAAPEEGPEDVARGLTKGEGIRMDL